MTSPSTQSYGNHRRWNPLYHFVAVPILGLNILLTSYLFYRDPNWRTGWSVILAIGIVAGLGGLRIAALIVQSRLIRLEMMLRLRSVLPPDLAARASELRVRQLVGLRFASDDELPALVQRCLSGELRSADQIKREVKNWQPDTLRA